MELISYPDKTLWNQLIKRPNIDHSKLFETITPVLANVQMHGDQALFDYELQFDQVALKSLIVSDDEIEAAGQFVSEELKKAIRIAKENIETFHASQRLHIKKIETVPGVVCWQQAVGIEKVGLYVPGGTAPLFSTVLMLAIPARIAGCKEVILCSPPNKEGKIHPAILFAAKESGVHRIFKIGGSQAIAAMAYGTESVPKVSKIFGPGNQYVTAAKQLVSLRDVSIDMPAGPSEVEIIADETANPEFVAADLLSQAEHGADSQVLLLTTSIKLAEKVQIQLKNQLELLPRKELAKLALENSKIILMHNMQDIVALTNAYAPEHLIIETHDYLGISAQITNAGSIFLGHYTPESAGDYASGTNHTLPTNGHAKAYSGVNLDSFTRKITYQEISKEGLLRLGKTIEVMAENEELIAHKNAVSLRIKK